jgi:hypothetical protein
MNKTALCALLLLISAVLFSKDLSGNGVDKLAMQSLDYRQFYNMGIQYGNAGLTGKAVLNLKRASLLEPKDKDIKTALSYYRATLGVPSYYFEQTPLENVLLFPFQFVGMNALLLIGLFMLFINCRSFLSRLNGRSR